MTGPQARRDGDEFVVQHDDGSEERIDMTSVMHRVDTLAYQRYMAGQSQPAADAAPSPETTRLEAAVAIARERRNDGA